MNKPRGVEDRKEANASHEHSAPAKVPPSTDDTSLPRTRNEDDQNERSPVFGVWLSQTRIEAGFFTQKELAEAAGIEPASVSRYEVGDSVPRGDNARRLAAALGMPQEEFNRQAAVAVNLTRLVRKERKLEQKKTGTDK